jgi:multimeric flavodoxin WrbA
MLEGKGFETRFWTVRRKRIEFCTHCDRCPEDKQCIYDDDMQDLYGLFKEAKGIIFVSPVYNGGVSAQIKTVMDRCRAVVSADKHFFRHKVGMGIAAGGDRIGGQENALMQIHTFYILNGVIPVSGGAVGSNLGATFWTKDTLDGAKQDEEGFRSLKKTVKRFAEFLDRYG